MNIPFATVAFYGHFGGYKFVIPLNDVEPLQEWKGIIEDWSIDDYENGCWHVQPVNTEYATPDGDRVVPGASHWTTDAYTSGNYWPNLVSAGVGSYHAYRVRTECTEVFTYRGGRWAAWSVETPNAPLPPPNIVGLKAVEEWLKSAGYTFWWTQPIYPTIQRAGVCASPLNKVTATAIRDKFLREHPLEPTLSTEYFSLLSSLKFNSNNFGNLQALSDAAKFFLNFKSTVAKKAAKSVAEKVADTWLAYRYSYSTTKADIQEAVRCARQLSHDSGILRSQFSAGGADCRLKIVYRPHDNTTYASIMRFMSAFQQAGFDPSLANVWDMIPYSFVVDWFVPIGDNLERMANQKWALTMPYSVDSLASIKGTTVYNGREYRVYTRFDYSPSYDLEWIDDSGTTLTTWAKRALDVVSLTR